ncbi:MAG: Histone deacetylase-like amidohydrolase [Firmicutes bacterium ADurb.Bin456]|nr:MAG: Histone deacetylase-like amidohydrolase [Firmicutes bacterium ADurb.Bin456]
MKNQEGKQTGLIFFPAFDWAISPTHPEREERLLYTRDQIFEEGIMDLPQIHEFTASLATVHDIARTHFCVPRVEDQTTEAHLIAAGAAILLAGRIVTGQIKNGFALVRPPGHHAMRVVHGNRGFCNINNEAIMVEYLRSRHGIKRVAIIDTDVHHGDGTQNIFWHDPDVLFISFHQDGRTIYPGTGFTHELGGPRAFARTINIPLQPGTSDENLLYVVDNLILPILSDFKPDFIVNSAGQDNHFTDPLGSMRISAQGYAKLTEKLSPDLAVLEGGYAIETALPYVNMAIILALAGLDYTNVREPDYWPERFRESPDRSLQVRKLVDQILHYWQLRDKMPPDSRSIRGQFYERNKRVFYDTDYIEEEQLERLKLCDNCPGYLTIDSRANHGIAKSGKVKCLSVPFKACSKCLSGAAEAYHQAKKAGSYRYVYLQDKSSDIFLGYDTGSGKEWQSGG